MANPKLVLIDGHSLAFRCAACAAGRYGKPGWGTDRRRVWLYLHVAQRRARPGPGLPGRLVRRGQDLPSRPVSGIQGAPRADAGGAPASSRTHRADHRGSQRPYLYQGGLRGRRCAEHAGLPGERARCGCPDCHRRPRDPAGSRRAHPCADLRAEVLRYHRLHPRERPRALRRGPRAAGRLQSPGGRQVR